MSKCFALPDVPMYMNLVDVSLTIPDVPTQNCLMCKYKIRNVKQLWALQEVQVYI